MNTKMIAGAIVQTCSIICPSRMNRLVCLFVLDNSNYCVEYYCDDY
jgi:hypothetical protein